MEIVPFLLAKKLKEKGFNPQKQPNYLYYNGELVEVKDHYNISPYEYAPTISQVLKWLREEKKIYIMINFWPAGYDAEIFTEIGKDRNSFCWERYIDECDYYDSYELAALAGVNYCLDNLI